MDFAQVRQRAAIPGSPILNAFKAEREAARAMQSARSQPLPSRSGARGPFSAATSDRFTASWMAGQRAINDELRGDLDALRSRARDLGKNNDYARKFLRMVARNVVGANGFTLQARVQDAPAKPDSLANSAIEAAWFKWAKRGSAEITGRMSFADACRVMMMATARDGESLARIVRGSAAGNPEGLALQLLDVARLDTQRNQATGRGRNAIIMGVEVDDYQRPLAYWLKDRADASTSSATRISAGEILHIYVPETAEQVRGIPWMHASMLSLHDLGEFNRSALLAARKGADTLGFITSPDGTAQGLGDMGGAEGEALQISAPGTYDVLPEGYSMQPYDSKYPNEVFDPFTKAILRRISSGLDVAYNGLANDLEGVNFSSIRAGVLEERDQWTTLQNWFIDAFLEPIYTEWFARAMTAGCITMPNGSALPIAKAAKFAAHEWQGRRWTWVDPLKDIEAARLEVKTGIASPQMIAARNGVDVEDVIASIAAFEAMVAASGVTLVDYSNGGSAPAADAAPAVSTALP
ncbi:phage portal protein [Comamonas aquatica]|uniref:phage portal protein n=1 Tax=Comamonas aquatica TaxID=225991 RepID=UPI0021B13089|nr:phage portal protein [Comamonas aquatica]